MKFFRKLLTILLVSFNLTSCDLFIPKPDFGSSPDSNINSGSGSTGSTTDSSISSSSSSSSTGNGGYEDDYVKVGIEQQTDSFNIPNSYETIFEDRYYTSKEDIAAYLIAFKHYPYNVMKATDRKVCVQKFPQQCILYGSEKFGNKEGLLPPQLSYKEIDLYAGDVGYSNNRGSLRLVYSVGNSNYKNDVVYYTNDHYASYSEYLNSYGSWTKTWNNLDDYLQNIKPKVI